MGPAPAAGAADARLAEPGQEEEPVTTGTLFLMLMFLMMIAGFWGLMYATVLHR
ncbi:MAG: cytochrome c oxidase subunit 2A [Gemmatimonadetes bacterium]|nr:cytochrome c oxidase subunit 2A [Gemmatimonadota bacterium]